MGGVSAVTLPQGIASALTAAGEKSNVDFDYLVQTAIRESSLNPEAKAATSSATGLFQFLDATWLQVMKEEGPRLGYRTYADAITRDSDGDYAVTDKNLRAEILKLREDPQVSADMAAAFTQANGEYLSNKFGRMPSAGELYIAHFMGPQGAEKLFKAGLSDPDQSAAGLFPRQARANPTIFYDSEGARSIKEVYQMLVAKHDAATATEAVQLTADPAFVTQQLAHGGTSRWPVDAVPARVTTDGDLGFSSMFRTEASSDVTSPLLSGGGSPLSVPTGSPLLAIEAVAGTSGSAEALFDPLPAPVPLIPEEAMAFTEAPPATQDTGPPRARVLITRPVPESENPFLRANQP